MLHVSDITKNLLSILKLTKDNNVIVEFYPDICFVKDRLTKKVIMQGRLRDGLCQLQLSDQDSSSKFNLISKLGSNPFGGYVATDSSVHNSSVSSSKFNKRDVWHRRLGHPSEKTVSQVMSLINENTLKF
jgi:hypothetical protein